MEKSLDAAALVEMFQFRGTAPDEDFVAEAGHDFGSVEAWEIGQEQYVVRYGNNAWTECEIVEDELTSHSDLGQWLIDDNLDDWDSVLNLFQVYGETVDEIGQNADTFRVLVERQFNGPHSEYNWAIDDDGETLEFDTAEAAEAWIESTEAQQYVLGHNESSEPIYTVIGR